MPDGSSSTAPLINPGPKTAKNRFISEWRRRDVSTMAASWFAATDANLTNPVLNFSKDSSTLQRARLLMYYADSFYNHIISLA
jgi:hypothetical protein